MKLTHYAFAAFAAVILLFAFAAPTGADNPPSQPSRGGDFVSLIVSYVEDPEDLDLDDLDELGATIKYVYRIIPAIALSLPSTSIDEVIEELEGSSRIERIESDLLVQANLDPDDPQYPNLWGLNNTGQTGGTPDSDIDAAKPGTRSPARPTRSSPSSTQGSILITRTWQATFDSLVKTRFEEVPAL